MMKSETDYVEYDSQMHLPFGLQDPMEMFNQQPQQQPPSVETPPYYLHGYHQAQWIRANQKRFPSPVQQPHTNIQRDPPPLHYPNAAPNVTMNPSPNRPLFHPQYRSQHFHMSPQEQQKRHHHMLQQNMMRMQNHMMIRQPRMDHNVPLQVPHGTQARQNPHMLWRFHNVRSAVPVNHVVKTPPAWVPFECQLSETPAVIEEMSSNQVVDDFQDFDVTDLLRLSFGDENEGNSRKRRSSKSSCEEAATKRQRRTKAELVSERNAKLLEQCKDIVINLESLELPEHVRIFGNKILRKHLPNVPNMKLSPKNIDFSRIRNIGYLVTKKGIGFSCMTDQCKFKSYKLDTFKDHLNTYHRVEGCGSTEGYCKICEKHCCGYSPLDEIEHILRIHVPIVEKHPMHQILHSRIKRTTNFTTETDLHEELSNILGDIEKLTEKVGNHKDILSTDDEESFPKYQRPRKNRNMFRSYDYDRDYNPENDEELESELEDEIIGDMLDEDSEGLLMSDEFSRLSEEENVAFDDTDSNTDISNSEWEIIEKKKEEDEGSKQESKPESCDDAFEDVPLYMLNRIKVHASTRSLLDEPEEPIKLNANVAEILEDMLKDETAVKEKKRKRIKSQCARKRTLESFAPQLNKVYNINSMTEFPSCRVLLKRLEDTSESEHNDVDDKKLETLVKVNKPIEVPINIPTPPSSESSRDSFPSPPLKKSIPKVEKITEIDSGLSDSSNSNKSTINEEIIEKNEDASKNTEDETLEQQICNKKHFQQVKEIKKTTMTKLGDKICTRNSYKLEKMKKFDDDRNHDKENSENEPVLEAPKFAASPNKISRPKAVKRQRFLKKFHKIDSFFQKTDNTIKEEVVVTENGTTVEDNTTAEDKTTVKDEVTVQDKTIEKEKIASKVNTAAKFNLNERDKLTPEEEITVEELEALEEGLVADKVIEIQESPNLSLPITISDDFDVKTYSIPSEIESQIFFDREQLKHSELTNLCELYPWINNKITKTVFKSVKSANVLKQETTQFSTYKCMEQTCIFFTTNFDKFKIHISLHKDNNYCSFCLYKGTTNQNLIDHIEDNHKFDRYQCNLCMYRAAEKVYVEWHQKMYHACPTGIVLKSPTQVLMKSTRSKVQEELKTENRRKYVLPYRCKTHGCDKEFFNKSNYKEHLMQELDSPLLSKYTNEIHNQFLQIDQNQIMTFKEGFNQCLYCEYGSDENADMYHHMADYHTNKLGFICRRVAEAVDDKSDENKETLDNQTRIEYIGASSFKIKLFKGSVGILTTSADESQMEASSSDETEQNENYSEANDSSNDILTPIINEINHVDSFRCLPILYN